MIWPKAACLLLPAMTFSCSSPGSFQCNTNANGRLFSTATVKADLSIRYPTTTRPPCGLDLKGLTGDADVLRGRTPLVVTKSDMTVRPAHGTADQHGTSISYTPQNGYVGADKFTVVLTGSAGAATGVSTIEVSVDVR